MNKLTTKERTRIVAALVEGNSIRSTCRLTGFSIPTVLKLLVELGDACEAYQRRTLRGLRLKDVQVDEVWSFVGCKQKHLKEGERSERGDAYTFVALDRASKLVPCFLVGKRDGWSAETFMLDLARALAPECRPQLSSDGFDPYPRAVEGAFGSDVDYGVVVKDYGAEDAGRGRYSPPRVLSVEKIAIIGRPDMDRITTSHVERSNLTIRMSQRRFTRLTNAFSKKLRNLRAAVALHFMYYNFGRVHQTLRVTPAMEAGVADHVWTLAEIVGLLNAPKAVPEPPPPAPTTVTILSAAGRAKAITVRSVPQT